MVLSKSCGPPEEAPSRETNVLLNTVCADIYIFFYSEGNLTDLVQTNTINYSFFLTLCSMC